MTEELLSFLLSFRGWKCSGFSAGKIGSVFYLHFHSSDDHQDKLEFAEGVRPRRGQMVLEVWCAAWRIDDIRSGEVVTSLEADNSRNGPLISGLKRVVDSAIESIAIEEPGLDCTVAFDNGLKLLIFPVGVESSCPNNYSLWTVDHLLEVGPRSALAFTGEEKGANDSQAAPQTLQYSCEDPCQSTSIPHFDHGRDPIQDEFIVFASAIVGETCHNISLAKAGDRGLIVLKCGILETQESVLHESHILSDTNAFWRLDDLRAGRVLSTSFDCDNNIELARVCLNQLLGTMVTKVVITTPALDLEIHFDEQFRLTVFPTVITPLCVNYRISSSSVSYTIGARSSVNVIMGPGESEGRRSVNSEDGPRTTRSI